MLHPTEQAVEYIWQRLKQTYLSKEALDFISQWKPIKEALNHKPFNAESPAYQALMDPTMQKLAALTHRHPLMPDNPDAWKGKLR